MQIEKANELKLEQKRKKEVKKKTRKDSDSEDSDLEDVPEKECKICSTFSLEIYYFLFSGRLCDARGNSSTYSGQSERIGEGAAAIDKQRA